MKKVLGVMLVFCLLAATSFLLPACVGEKGATEGQLPTYQVGDKWVWSYVMDGTTSILTEEVTGEETVEGRRCYVMDMSFDPASSWTQDDVVCTMTSMKYWIDKATCLYGVKHEYSITCNGQVSTSTTTYSYKPWTSLFPLEIGKEVETEKTAIMKYSMDGEEQVGEPTVTTEKYKVVSKEDVTVTAGTFSCWKITMSDSARNVTQTTWWADQVKTMVKMDEDGKTMGELQSYSVR